MHFILKNSVLLVLIASCSNSKEGSKDAPSTPPKEDTIESSESRVLFAAIPAGEEEVFNFDGKATFGKANFSCAKSGYGYALNESLNKMAVCCVAFDQLGLSEGTIKFTSRLADRIIVKPEKCEAVALSGSLSDISLPIEIDLSEQKFVTISRNASELFNKALGQVSMVGSESFSTKLVGPVALKLYGKAKVSNIHSLGTAVVYQLRDTSGFNQLEMSNVKIEGKDSLTGGLVLTTGPASTSAITGSTLKFEKVTVEASKANPVMLINYPFDTSGIEITAGKKYSPHIGLIGEYADTTGFISEMRYPIVVSLKLEINSHLKVGPGVKIKVPVEAKGSSAFNGNKFSLSMLGTAENKIVVTSIKDDSVGGDSNGDANATQGSKVRLIVDQEPSSGNDYKLAMFGARLVGAALEVSRESSVTIGDIAIEPAQDQSYWNHPILLRRGDGTRRYPDLLITGPVDVWLPVETYNTGGDPGLSAPIYAGAWGSAGASIIGIDYVVLHNTSTSANRVDGDVRVVSNDAGACFLVQDSRSQVTAETKNWTYYIENRELKRCE